MGAVNRCTSTGSQVGEPIGVSVIGACAPCVSLAASARARTVRRLRRMGFMMIVLWLLVAGCPVAEQPATRWDWDSFPVRSLVRRRDGDVVGDVKGETEVEGCGEMDHMLARR